jgi:hypothetical protein
MARKKNPRRANGEGSISHRADDDRSLTANRLRTQFLMRFGLPGHRAALLAPIAFGEAC